MSTKNYKKENKVIIIAKKDELIMNLNNLVASAANYAITRDYGDRTFRFGISESQTELLKYFSNIKTMWSKWLIFLCEELFPKATSKESIVEWNWNSWRFNIPIDIAQFIHIQSGKYNTSQDAAVAYCEQLHRNFEGRIAQNGFPRFDCLLLNLDINGCTCALRKNTKYTEQETQWVGWTDELSNNYIGLSLKTINSTRMCIFFVTGNDNARVVKQILEDEDESIPATKVKPYNGTVFWLLDENAASMLNLEKLGTIKKIEK